MTLYKLLTHLVCHYTLMKTACLSKRSPRGFFRLENSLYIAMFFLLIIVIRYSLCIYSLCHYFNLFNMYIFIFNSVLLEMTCTCYLQSIMTTKMGFVYLCSFRLKEFKCISLLFLSTVLSALLIVSPFVLESPLSGMCGLWLAIPKSGRSARITR